MVLRMVVLIVVGSCDLLQLHAVLGILKVNFGCERATFPETSHRRVLVTNAHRSPSRSHVSCFSADYCAWALFNLDTHNGYVAESYGIQMIPL